jgi:hypothetical protein
MKNKILIMGIIAAVAIIAGAFFVARPFGAKKVKTARAAVKAEKTKVSTQAKKPITKGMGGLTVKVLNSKGKEAFLKAKAFSVVDSKSSIFTLVLTTNRMQELSPGTYDIEVDTTPQKIYKNIKVTAEKENVLDLGCPTGSVTVKALNSKKKEASYLVKLVIPKSNILVTAGTTNRPLEVMPGIYDIEIDTMPRLVKRAVKLDAAKETAVDLGVVTGGLTVKVTDENGRDLRYTAKVRNASTGEIISSNPSNRAVEIQPGAYNIEVLTSPAQTKKDIKVIAGEQVLVEFTVQSAAREKPSGPPQAKR